MTLRVLLSACIAIGMHSSLCTGGLFAITAAVASDAAYAKDHDGPMSYGAIGYLSCKTSKKNAEVSAQEPGCSDAKACISKMSESFTSKLFYVAQFTLSVPELLSQPYHSQEITKNPTAYARAGPLYESAPTFAHSLLKRE